MNIQITAPAIEHKAVWLFKQGEAPILNSWQAECEHANKESIELAAGLTATFDPITVPGTLCLDCEEVIDE